ncbi:MAG: hypothetical protein Q8N69_03105 [bacterium]|nr:hypothetical protein [bacterium]
MPKGGGIGIPLSLIVIVFFGLGIYYLFLIFALILVLISLLDDRINLSIPIRLLAQFILGMLLVLSYKDFLFAPIRQFHGPVALVLVILYFSIYVVAATNIFNFMDGINGIAGFEAIISYGFLWIFVHHYKNLPDICMISLSVCFSTLGFLVLNFPKARVFMGDAGSTFLGFLYAGMVVFIAATLKETLVLTLFQSVFYVDAISTIFLRILNKENILQAHNKHLYQKLVHQYRLSHTTVTLFYGLAQTAIALVALLLSKSGIWPLLSLWGLIFIIYWGLMIKLDLVKSG